MTPTSYPAGSAADYALVVYDPGSTGAVKSIATKIASDFQAQGYFVELAGIKSTIADGDLSQYQVIVVGGLIQNGKASNSVQSYLKNLTPVNGTQVGVFGVSTTNSPNDQIAPLPSSSSLVIKETLEISTSQNTTTESSAFVTGLIS